MNVSLYMCGKIYKGDQANTMKDWRAEFKIIAEKLLQGNRKISGFVYLDPHTMTGELPMEGYYARDIYMVSTCNAVVVDASQKIGPGAGQEMIIAKYFGKPVVTILPKDSYNRRKTVIDGIEVDYKNPFLVGTSDVVVETKEQAIEWLLDYFSGKIMITIKGINVVDNAVDYYLSDIFPSDSHMKEWKKEMDSKG